MSSEQWARHRARRICYFAVLFISSECHKSPPSDSYVSSMRKSIRNNHNTTRWRVDCRQCRFSRIIRIEQKAVAHWHPAHTTHQHTEVINATKFTFYSAFTRNQNVRNNELRCARHHNEEEREARTEDLFIKLQHSTSGFPPVANIHLSLCSCSDY